MIEHQTSDERVRGDHEKEVKNEPTNTTKSEKKPRAMKDEILWPRERIGEHTTVQGRKSDEWRKDKPINTTAAEEKTLVDDWRSP